MDVENDLDRSDEAEDESHQEEDFGLCLPRRLTGDKGVSSRSIGFTKTSNTCFHLIHEAMYKNEWDRAAGLFTAFVQSLESQSSEMSRRAPEIIWRLGSEILLNHPKSMPEDINVFNDAVKNIGVKRYLPISLEQAFSLLCSGQTEEAYRTLAVTESWRFGKISISQSELLKLVQAYRAVLDYHSWLDRQSVITQTEMDYASQSSTTKDMSGFFRQASVALQEILQCPGVWDPFVLSYVNLLESSGNEEEAEKVLVEYAYNNKNPANPNAHVYLYEFKKRRGDSDGELIKVLKILHALVPSHRLMLEFSRLLRHSESEEHHQLALQVLFDLLDFSGWKDNVEVWSRLAKQLKRSLRCDRTFWISETWTSRSDWWPSYHFTQFQVKKDWGNCMELAIKKASVAAMLQGQDCNYFSSVYQMGNPKQKKTLDRVIKVLKP
ncbi:TATA box-binding protein-associated factor RNA polymerase I subunit A isoform 1-T2 [Mantella aurantiaca]